MLNIGGTELLVIALVLILVVGPKDLPRVLRTIGQFMGKMRGMTREFQKSIDDMAREADVADMRKELKSVSDTVSGSVTDSDVTKKVENTIDSTGLLRDAMKEDYGLSDEAAEKAAAKLPPLPDRGEAEADGSKAEGATEDDADTVEAAPAVQEEKQAQVGGAAEA